MENLTINIDTIHGNFDFNIIKIPYTDNVIIESECLFGGFTFKPEYVYHKQKCIDMFVSVYQSSTGIHILEYFDMFIFDFTSVDTIDLEKFGEIINYILTEHN